MVKSITQNEIVFSKVKTVENEGILEVSAGIKVSQADGVDPDYGGIINAVDIDWNEADFSTVSSEQPTTINTSGDLIKAIKWASTLGSGSGGGHGQMGVTGAQGIHGISS